jgi:ribosomal protein S18 acetylase RimI-like enzyme
MVRPATDNDLDAVLACDVRAVGDPARVDLLRRAVAEHRCLVAGPGDAIVGYVVTAPASFLGRDFVELLVVRADARRAGTGRMLLRAAAEAAGTDQVFTSTNESNVPMRSLLERDGWRFSGQLDGLDPGDPELVFFTFR